VDQSKVEAIKAWLQSKSVTKVRSFHGLASFYTRFIKDFSSIIAPITKFMKKGVFEWTKATQRALEEIKQKLCQASILALPSFNDLSKVECGASGWGLGLC